MWGSKAFLSTELPLVSRISSKATKAAEEKFDLILFQSLMVSIDTRWTSSLAAVVEFITAGQTQSRVEFQVAMSRSRESLSRQLDPLQGHGYPSRFVCTECSFTNIQPGFLQITRVGIQRVRMRETPSSATALKRRIGFITEFVHALTSQDTQRLGFCLFVLIIG